MMQKIAMIIALIISIFFCRAQLSQHIGVHINSPTGLNMKPYNDPFLDMAAMAGIEVGYRIFERLDIRAFIFTGISSKDQFIDDTPASSSLLEWGIKPQVQLLSNRSEVFNFDVGVAISHISNKIEWVSTDALARGEDNARLLRLGIAPAMRWYLKKSRATFQIAVHINHDQLLEARREIYYNDNNGEDLSVTPLHHRAFNMGARCTFGYSFW